MPDPGRGPEVGGLTSGELERIGCEPRASRAPLVERILASGSYPAVSQFVECAQDLDPETAFETALRRILDGIQASLPASRC